MLNQVRIRNFKSLEDVAVDLSPVTVLVGRSGTGKSNFVDALRFLRDFLVQPEEVLRQRDDWLSLLPAFKEPAAPSFDLVFDVEGIDGQFAYRLAFWGGPKAQVLQIEEESLSLGGELLFGQALVNTNYRWLKEPNVVGVPNLGQTAIGKMPAFSEAAIAYTALTAGIGCYDFPANVMCSRRRGQQSQDRTHTQGLQDHGQNFLEVVQTLSTNLRAINVRKGIAASLKTINSTITSIEPDSVSQPTRLIVGHDVNGRRLGLDLSQESDGFRRYYAHLLALYQQPPKETLVFEHPEDGIYPGALSLLAEEFQAAPESGRGQVILTTHSPGLLDHFSAEQIRVFALEDLRTRIGLVAKEQFEALQENLLTAGELLTVDPARIDQPETAGT